ncbi:MAG: ATP-binding protein [Flavisolibacter sp.]
MKKILCISLVVFSVYAKAQTHQLVKLWETDSVIAIPESVLPDTKKGILYVTLIDGGGWDVDGKGGIAKMDIDGKKYKSDWVVGMHAPKGMAIVKNKMYVADINQVFVIDIKKGKIDKKIAWDSALGLNDVTSDDKGIVYVSDSRTGKIWRIEKDVPTLYLDNLKGLNGLKAVGEDLYIGSGKTFVKANSKKELTTIAEVTQGIDGIEPVGNGDFILTAWMGYIWYVEAGGKVETLLESHAQKMNTADIGYDPEKRIVYVPTFNAKRVIAYQLK